MHKGRLEAFSDAVIAIIMTILVLNIQPPKSPVIEALGEVAPNLGAYALSFLILGIYWNNHHHLLQAAQKVNGKVLWANVHLLFWLSLFPFTAGWMGVTKFASGAVFAYGLVMFTGAISYYILSRSLVGANGKDSPLAKALGADIKGRASVIACGAATPVALLAPLVALGVYILVAIAWLIPDRRFERLLSECDAGAL